MRLHNIRIEPEGKIYTAGHGSSLFELLKGSPVEFTCGGRGICGNCTVRLLSGKVEINAAHAGLLKKKGLSGNWIVACLSKIEDDLVIEIPPAQMQIQTEEASFKFTPEEGMGIAVDLGSTTVVLQLVDLHSGRVAATRYGLNPQVNYGADIISRIQYAMESTEHRETLKKCIREYLKQETAALLAACPAGDLRKMAIVGNSVMHHLFLGYDVTPLAFAPFDSPIKAGCLLTSQEVGWDFSPSCRIEFLPNMGHFVGSDIIGGIQASGMLEEEGYSLLVDLGTNGEIVLGNRHEILYTSTAAGPAFEGLNISCGMKAVTGAISAVDLMGNELHLHVIGGGEAKGICGSGLIEATACLLQRETIDFTGAFTDVQCGQAALSEQVKLTAGDIRNLQLAKAALSAGIILLLQEKSLAPAELSHVYLTGGLGNHLNLQKAQQLGLFTGFTETQMRFLGNAALSGCKQFLFRSNRDNLDSILAKSTFCPLESSKSFPDVYCGNMFFMETDAF